MNKPAYPSDSPKPANLLEFAKLSQSSMNTPPRAPPRIFEFPDTKVEHVTPPHKPRDGNMENSTVKNDFKLYSEEKDKQFEPRGISTPITKTRIDYADHEPPSYKNSSMLEINKSDKVSPTNSMIRAMIYSKSKPKRKNLIASELFVLS